MRSAWRVPGFLAVCGALLLGGCAGSGRAPIEPDQRPIQPTSPPPSAKAVQGRYNARLATLKALRTPVSLAIDYYDQSGNPARETAQGALILRPPMETSLRVDKIGQTVAHLGSNKNEFFWIELGDPKRGVIGAHEDNISRDMALAGIPVHPLDLIELLGVTPLPDPATELFNVNWSTDGRSVAVLTTTPRGLRRLFLDPRTMQPRRIELLDSVMQPVASARLDKYEILDVGGPLDRRPRLATVIEVDVPTQSAKISISLATIEDPGRSLREAVFIPRS